MDKFFIETTGTPYFIPIAPVMYVDTQQPTQQYVAYLAHENPTALTMRIEQAKAQGFTPMLYYYHGLERMAVRIVAAMATVYNQQNAIAITVDDPLVFDF